MPGTGFLLYSRQITNVLEGVTRLKWHWAAHVARQEPLGLIIVDFVDVRKYLESSRIISGAEPNGTTIIPKRMEIYGGG